MSGILKKTAVAAALLATMTGAHAYVLLGNLAQTSAGNRSATSDLTANGFGWTSTVGNATLGNVSLVLRSTSAAAANVTLALYTTASGIPTTSPVATFTTPSLAGLTGTADSTIVFTPSAYTLQANTDYYLVLRNTSATALNWRTTGGTSALNNGATAAASANSASGGVSFNRANTGVDFTSAGLANKLIVQIDYTPVPEPETYAMFAGLGLLGFAFVRRTKAA